MVNNSFGEEFDRFAKQRLTMQTVGSVENAMRMLSMGRADYLIYEEAPGQAYANNVGWRLDYHLATPALAQLARTEAIYKGQKFSDHAPITIGYELAL